MRTPAAIATFACVALSAAAAAGEIVGDIWSPLAGHFLNKLPLDLLEAALFGALVWVGTYLGVRRTPVQQRTFSFKIALAAVYFVCGLVMTLPVTSHAVKLDMPQTGGTARIDIVVPLLAAICTLVLFVAIPFVMTRFVSAICNRLVKSGA
jgi:hypothetical protein